MLRDMHGRIEYPILCDCLLPIRSRISKKLCGSEQVCAEPGSRAFERVLGKVVDSSYVISSHAG